MGFIFVAKKILGGMTVEDSISEIKALLAREPKKPLTIEMRSELLDMLDSCGTGSDLAAGLRAYIPALFEAYSYDLMDALKDTLSTAIWRDNGVLIASREIPLEGPDEFLVLGDDTVRQHVPKEVTYLGDVSVNIHTGVAHVMDTRNFVNASGYARVDAHGHSRVNAYDKAIVSAHDFAKVSAHDHVIVHAHDFSFVDAGHDFVTLHAHDNSQFYVGLGEPRIYMDGSVRGYIYLESVPDRPVVVHMEDNGLLYAKATRPEHLNIHSENFSGTLIRGEKTTKADQLMMDMIIPRYANKEIEEVGISKPLPMDELLRALAPFLKGNLEALQNCSDENALCAQMKTYLPILIQNGLTGDFLRRHFTQETLEANLIHAFTKTNAKQEGVSANETHYFFGSGLVHGDRYGHVRCYERTLLVSDNGSGENILGGEATGIAVNWGKLEARERSKAVSFDSSHVSAYDHAVVQLNGYASAEASGRSVVYGNGSSYVNARGESVVYLDEGANATVNDSVRLLAEGKNHIEAHNKSVVGYPSYNQRTKVTILNCSHDVVEKELKTSKEYIDYRISLGRKEEKDLERGMRR